MGVALDCHTIFAELVVLLRMICCASPSKSPLLLRAGVIGKLSSFLKFGFFVFVFLFRSASICASVFQLVMISRLLHCYRSSCALC
jgi:hypothetical protein